MTVENLKELAVKMHKTFTTLQAKRLYVTAFFYPAEAGYSDRILVQGIKNLRTTGKFRPADLQAIDKIISDFTDDSLNLKRLNANDSCMYNLLITIK